MSELADEEKYYLIDSPKNKCVCVCVCVAIQYF